MIEPDAFDANVQAINNDFDKIIAALRKEKAKNAELRAALEKIAEGKGAFSLDPLTHASNTIDDMKALANAALGETP